MSIKLSILLLIRKRSQNICERFIFYRTNNQLKN